MTSTPKPIKLEITDLEDVQKEVQILKNRINGYRIKTVELQNQIKELDKL